MEQRGRNRSLRRMVRGMNAKGRDNCTVPDHGPTWRRASWLTIVLAGAVLAGCGSSAAAPASRATPESLASRALSGGVSPGASLTSLDILGKTFPVAVHNPAIATPAECGRALVALSKTIGAVGSAPTAAWLHQNVGMVLDRAGGAPSALAAAQKLSSSPVDQSCLVDTGSAEMATLNVLASTPGAANQILATPQPKAPYCSWTANPDGRLTIVTGACSSATGSPSSTSYAAAEIFPSRWFVIAEGPGTSGGSSALGSLYGTSAG